MTGKKNKAPAPKGSPKAKASAGSAEKQQAPPETKDAAGGWAAALKELSPEAQAYEEEKQKQRNEKAAIAAALQQKQNEKNEWYEKERQKTEVKKQREERKWDKQLGKDKQKALEEGILEAQEGTDGLWWVEVAPKTWRECSGQYFCTLCEKHLNDSTLTAHLESEGHRKKRDWMLPGLSANTSTPPPPSKPKAKASPPSQPSQWCAPCNDTPLEEWQERSAEGYIRCIPCGKLCDGQHELTQGHLDRLEWWAYKKETEKNGYAPPALEYLAYVPYDEVGDPNGQRGLRCLLCKKWCNDDWSHTGSHANPDGSKEHQKNLRNYGPGNQWWEDEVVKVRLRYHPKPKQQAAKKAAAKPATLAPWATPEHLAAASSSMTARQPENKVELPEGWTAHQDDSGNTYYYHEASQQSTWDFPENAEPQKNQQEGTLPPDWHAVKDENGDVYYHNTVTNETQWDPPDMEVLWKEAKDDDGNVYYYNAKTGESTWDKPDGF